MKQTDQTQADYATIHLVAAGEDRFGEQRGLGISAIHFKITTCDTNDILVIENNFQESGGPARHLHYNHDEWFFAVESDFISEVGRERFRLNPGDSLLAPPKMPHVWAFAGGAHGAESRLPLFYVSAGKMETFFREVTKADAMPPQESGIVVCA